MYRFGDVVVDPRAREVRRRGEVVHLEPQAFDLLVHLIEHRQDVVDKQRLLDAVWGHGFVTESALTTRIKEIRRAVGDDGATQHTISTIRGRGYRFVAPLVTETPDRRAPATRHLVGRDEDLARVLALLRDAAFVTLVGPGGVGKSALARAVLERVSAEDDGPEEATAAYLVELAPLAGGEAVLPAVAAALGVVFDGERWEHLVSGLARRDAIVVLDNCEHVVDAVGDLVDRILATPGRHLRVLATSQVRLGVAGEHVVAVAPLDVADAITLFTERASAVRGEESVEVETLARDRERLASLLEHLDRLPLTIEMAAGRLASMTFADLEAAVRDSGLLSRMSHRTPTPRHRTVTSLVEWAVATLPEEERDTFARMSVFAGAVGTAEARAVLGPEAGLLLPALADRSLLSVDLRGETARYRMLETVRAVAGRRLEEIDAGAQTGRRHAEWAAGALELVDEALRGVEESAGLRRLGELLDELRVAHRWARDHDLALADRMCTALHVPGYNRVWGEPAGWAAEIIDRQGHGQGHGVDEDPDPVAVTLPGTTLLIAGAAAHAGQLDRAESLALAVLRAASSARHAAMALDVLSDVALYAGRLDDVEERVGELAAVSDRLGDRHWVALAAVNGSLARTFRDDGAAGLEVVSAVDRAGMSTTGIAWLSYAEGEAHAAMGATEAAVAAFERATALGEDVANPFVTSVSHSALAAVLGRSGSRRDAYAAYERGLTSALQHGNLVHAVTMVRNLAELLHEDGDLHPAVVLASATADEIRRPVYGEQGVRLAALVDEALEGGGHGSSADEVRTWMAEGAALDVDAAVRHAIQLVRAHCG